MRVISSSNRPALARLLDRAVSRDRAIEARVRAIVADVRQSGDRALVAYARRYDGLDGPIEFDREAIAAGARLAPPAVRRAIRRAARNIRAVARRQLPRPFKLRVAAGLVIEQRVTPLARVGCYVPGGRHPLPSSLLMTAIPAQVAGVADIVAVCPQPAPAVLAAAAEAGVSRLYRVGGAHAIAALAYGTSRLPRVDKIVGPGNAYVAAAKSLVAADCPIDFEAGPSEIVVVAGKGEASWIAADLIAQAEHDVDARAILLTWSKRLASAVRAEIERQLPAEGPARQALARNGGIVLTRDLREAIALADRMAPEHLVCENEAVVKDVRAGAVFVGRYSVQAAGDYATGSNHVLPTSGAARSRGGLSAADFVRVSNVQRLTRRGLAGIAPTATALAHAEGLTAHARSIDIRLPEAAS